MKCNGMEITSTDLLSLVSAANDLKEIVDGAQSKRWATDCGPRLRDTPEWCKFYTTLARVNRDNDLSEGSDG